MAALTPHIVYMAVGSNLGDKLQNCRQGVRRFIAAVEGRMTGQSKYYRTAPVDFPDQDWFVNGAFRMVTTDSPEMLLKAAKSVERAAGRSENGVRYGPRVLDLDIVFYDDRVIDRPGLRIPHPKMHLRRFVLQPICDIESELVHPVLQKTVRDLLGRIDDAKQSVTALKND
jgi:2-amino-4-hydroxy-6-hydroxymethyldihydropteridine diphosphokinase